ncbi:aminotransferase class I/II-fold pyridoxal phosphate-dependent enzyme, partial [Streptomyces sp. NPDC051940]|uniref:aminotransferase class I/II-fold pyridoxal phosphate-dependent enzyme n=1 Tax=Streptomyces sp. NPDC051940 TaxID=3155675 RepID=UPI00342A271D
ATVSGAPSTRREHLLLAAYAAGWFARRGLHTGPGQVAAAPGARLLLLALLAATDGDVLIPRPAAEWHAAQARLLGRAVHTVPVQAESGGAPDPVALLETLARLRADGGDPRLLVLSVADEVTGTVPPPEILYEVCEAAAGAGVLVVSDETYRDTRFDPHDTMLVSPAEMSHGDAVALAGLDACLLPSAWPAAVARFPAGPNGVELRRATVAALAAMGAAIASPVAEAAALALTEPSSVTARTGAAARLNAAFAAAAVRILADVGAECRPPQAGSCVYADFDERRRELDVQGVTGAAELEAWLAARLGPGRVAGGHRFGDPPDSLRVRFALLPLFAGADDARRTAALDAPQPLRSPHVTQALAEFGTVIAELTGVVR